jgi:hypothetical protein
MTAIPGRTWRSATSPSPVAAPTKRRESSSVRSNSQAGQVEEARRELAQLKETHPDLSIAWIERYVPYTPGPMAKFVEGMRKAGLT